MLFDLIYDGKVINSCDAEDADHISEMVSSMYPDNWTDIKIVSRNHRAYHFLKEMHFITGSFNLNIDYMAEAKLNGFK